MVDEESWVPRCYLVVDLEATTDDGEEHERAVPRDEMETIEIGAVLVQAPKFEIIGAFQTFVRPILHPTLTPFCTRLTGISQSMLVDAPSFPKALDALCQGMLRERDGVAWASWGMFDQTQLARDCALHQVAYPMPEHLNLKDLFSVTQGRRKRYGMKKALRLAGLTPQGVHHRALPDAMNAARLLPWIVGDKRIG